MDIIQTACRSAAISSARPSLLLAAHPFRPTATSILFQNCRFSTTQPSLKDDPPSFPFPRPSARPIPISGVQALRQTVRSRGGNNASLPPRPGPPQVGDLLSPNFRDSIPKRPMNAADLPGMIDEDVSKMRTWDLKGFQAEKGLILKEQVIRTRPSTGRTVLVTGSSDVGRSFRTLEMLCKRNRVSREANMQRFHERPALKRKRQKRERWRARFQQGVRATISRVMQLRAQGW
ncbi:hypothetical protein B0H67DRAFT_578886 [Lasiosphaeris hirsuta]|uniref:Ribosomal protein S21 n=1 Tax=Lasiosphaeris hirsuta TaxID=260670 RepID=A0AA40AF49_9PEZI|nr:hypothetical protein B0H67DRAFT_578886 [Lasiosphaeris hirsuta]